MRERAGEKENGRSGRMRIKLQPEVFLQECRGAGVARRGWKSITEASERGREELGSKKGERDGEQGRLIGKDSLSAICEAKEGNRR